MNIELFSERIAHLISLHNSASKLARMAGVSESVVRKWKNGESEPSREKLQLLIAATGVSAEWLVLGTGEVFANKALFQVNSRSPLTLSTANKCIDEIHRLLDEAGEDLVDKPSNYVSLREELQGYATSDLFPEELKNRVDMMLSLAFNDIEASMRQKERQKSIFAKLSSISDTLTNAEQHTGNSLPPAVRENIKTLMFDHKLSIEVIAQLIVSITETMVAKK
ncbi:MAG: helix-turn-helix domain-containing protein [Oleispira sp.]|nr:helix-turn-helix domain-containing protein [Oleispira sp.]